MIKDLLKKKFTDYVNQVFLTEIDINFWKHFLEHSISEYQKKNPDDDWINDAGFTAYNINRDPSETWLFQSEISHTIWRRELKSHSDRFFSWIMNSSLVRAYNSCELVLFETAQIVYFPELPSPSLGKRQLKKLTSGIKADLVSNQLDFDITNNRFLISYFSFKSREFAEFVNQRANPDWDITWKQFFELFSTLRNVVAHQEMFVTTDTLNTIKSFAKKVFGHYFEVDLKDNSSLLLTPRDSHVFLDLLHKMTDFVANTMKFLVNESDIRFLGMRPV